jgi:glyoxylase-like metal-dependent hydrolase (beta-lactamase superfamily II)
MMVKQLKVGSMENFVYVVSDPVTKEALVIDSGWDVGPALEFSKEGGHTIKFVLATHEHFDHTRTIKELAARAGAKVVAHVKSPLEADLRVDDGDTMQLGKSEIQVLHTPGHTEDSICVYDGRNLFTGDTLFIGTCGRTDLPGGSAEKLYDSLYRKILNMPPDTEIYPGHDYGDVPHRRLDEEAKRNPALLAKDLKTFLRLFS